MERWAIFSGCEVGMHQLLVSPKWRWIQMKTRAAPIRSWLAVLAAAVLIAALAGGTATAATPTTVADRDPAVITDWNALAVITLVDDTTNPPPPPLLHTPFRH